MNFFLCFLADDCVEDGQGQKSPPMVKPEDIETANIHDLDGQVIAVEGQEVIIVPVQHSVSRGRYYYTV